MKTDERIKLTTVKCPGCKKLHKIRMNWIGKGTPYKFCRSCQGIVDRNGIIDEKNN